VESARVADGVRLAELMATLSLVTDLGLGRPLGRELAVCLSALELAERLGVAAETRVEVYYVALVAHIGCTAAAPHLADWVAGDEIRFQQAAEVLGPMSEPGEDLRFFARRFADDRPLPERLRLVAAMLAGGQARFARMAADLCDGGRLLAERLHLPAGVALALGQYTERWDGKGFPGQVSGEAIAPAIRIVRVAHDLLAVGQARGLAAAVEALRRRRGRGYDPAAVDAALAEPQRLVEVADVDDGWERVIAAEPAPAATV
jgi:HD domain